MSEHDRYFQEISRVFLARRGAPFFLSPKDLELIAAWEKAGVPLAVVLEGIERAFAPGGGRPGPRGKVLALSFCRNQVRALYDLRRDRRVGLIREPSDRGEKRARARAEVDGFLEQAGASIPPGIAVLALQARAILGSDELDEEVLERIDDEVDRVLAAAATDEERRAAGATAPGLSESAVRTKLANALREKYRLPYFALYNY
jgi:hypothetical protein